MTNAYQLTDIVKLLQKLVLLNQTKFLILRRSPQAKSRPDQWDLPGGNVMWPNSTVDLINSHLSELRREVQEETGFDLDFKAASNQIKQCYFGTYFEAGHDTYTVIAGYSVALPNSIDADSVQISTEHTAFAWITLAEFDNQKYDFGFAGQSEGFITQIVHQAFAK